MNTCWKCGAETPNTDSECDKCAFNDLTPAALQQALQKLEWFEIDWEKVKTIEDLRQILLYFPITLHLPSESPAFFILRQFLKKSHQP